MTTTTKPRRIEPQLDAQGRPLELNPPCGGEWMREADGGLVPLDRFAAEGAGLAFGAEVALAEIEAAAADTPGGRKPRG